MSQRKNSRKSRSFSYAFCT